MTHVAVIPALEPDERLVAYTQALLARGFARVVIVDDGSGADYADLFAQAAALTGATVLRHEVNRGKGAALKTAYRHLLGELDAPAVIVTADSDGQHAVEDVWEVSRKMEKRLPERAMILGTRDFSREDVPFKSRAGNRITTVSFFLACRIWLSDTQTGLRAFSSELLEEMLAIEGDRYEYEMRVLSYAAHNRIALVCQPIQTVYENNNAGSHFHPWRDSARVYRALFGPVLRYALASLAGTLVDLLAFYLLSAWLFRGKALLEIAGATVAARAVSATVNYLLNRSFVFQRWSRGAALRYAMLVVCSLIVSSGAVYLAGRMFSWSLGRGGSVETAKTVFKAVVDTLLFVVNYQLCRRWVFVGKSRAEGKRRPD